MWQNLRQWQSSKLAASHENSQTRVYNTGEEWDTRPRLRSAECSEICGYSQLEQGQTKWCYRSFASSLVPCQNSNAQGLLKWDTVSSCVFSKFCVIVPVARKFLWTSHSQALPTHKQKKWWKARWGLGTRLNLWCLTQSISLNISLTLNNFPVETSYIVPWRTACDARTSIFSVAWMAYSQWADGKGERRVKGLHLPLVQWFI